MSTARADGNAAFKKGRWVDAITHYTTAIESNPDDPIVYTNRAAAYLKLEKYEDVERDCTAALRLDEQNLKALYRRALARRGMRRVDEAKRDLDDVLRLDPENETAQAESQELQADLQQQLNVNRRTFADLRKTRDIRKTHVSTPPTTPGAGLVLVRQLSTLSPAESWSLLTHYPPQTIPQLIAPLLEPDTLAHLLLALRHGVVTDKDRVRDTLQHLKTTPRWKINMAMLSPHERKAGQEAWEMSGGLDSWS